MVANRHLFCGSFLGRLADAGNPPGLGSFDRLLCLLEGAAGKVIPTAEIELRCLMETPIKP